MGMPRRLTRHRGLQQQLTAGWPYTGPSTNCGVVPGDMISENDTLFFLGYALFFLGLALFFFPGIYYTRIFGSNVSIWQIQCFPAVDQFGAIIPVFLQVRN